ncbi:putative toxin-antitoxin system toxin component, PIN family [Salinibacter altiplanensis]|uniref:putative toxin-antitoxin system toxin component, PIN family n=1 Tax=Salinibacter altiplanensis TaxID=1803181 RepID=UPI000C9FE1AC|nr:putative toxin-antitoxin system toxin component, PIN family [Salinibacter altiplanensis]
MRVFLDTNVIVSGFATRGLSSDVVRLLMAQHELLTSEVVLEETRRVLTEKFGVPEERADEIERLLRQCHVEPVPETGPPVEVRDPDDEVVLASAIAAEAEILITGDKDLLDIADEVESLRVMTPRAFWEEVR